MNCVLIVKIQVAFKYTNNNAEWHLIVYIKIKIKNLN